jgi:hypothetical protein
MEPTEEREQKTRGMVLKGQTVIAVEWRLNMKILNTQGLAAA